MVVNLTKDKVWVRDGIVPDFPSQAPPKFDIAAMGGLIIPAPKNKRQDFQEQSIRDAEIPPEEYLSEGLQAGIDSVLANQQTHLHSGREGVARLVAGGKPAATTPPAPAVEASKSPVKK